MKAKRVLLIGWDAADWKVIDQLVERGHMPTLKRMMEQGVRGNLSTLEPVLSPMLWTSIATGKFADKHGIVGFTEADYESGMVRPVTSTSRRSRAIWNILNHQGKKTNIFSWWPSNPAEPVNGIMVSNLYQRANRSIDKPWPMARGTVFPSSLNAHFAQCRIHPDELTEEHITPFIPLGTRIDQDKDKHIASLSRIIADAATVHAASTWALENTEWDFTAIYHDAIDHSCHGFMKFRAPQLPGLPDELFERYRDVVDGMYRFHDMMLERTLQLAGPDTNVILMSDHGFQSDHLRPLVLPKEPAAPALEHRKHGILCCMGPDFKEGEQIYGASVIDITPTLLTLFGLPVGEDMDGTPLLQLFKEVPEVQYIPSWQDVEGDFFEHQSKEQLSPEEARQSVQQLVDLGYIDDPGENAEKAFARTEREADYNLARVYLSTDRLEEGMALLEHLIAREPEYRFEIRLADCYRRQKRYDEALALLESMAERDRPKDETSESAEGIHHTSISMAKAEILRSMGNANGALQILVDIQARKPNSMAVFKAMAECFIALKQWRDAANAYRQCLTIDPHDSISYKGLAECLLRQGQYEEAAEHALHATELIYQYPVAHFILGESLYHLKAFDHAARALEVAVAMRPAFSAPRLLLDRLYKETGLSKEKVFEGFQSREGDPQALASLAESHARKATHIKKRPATPIENLPEIIVVSGLPRSGTSLMMQMLQAGGISIFTDEQRTADEHNPKGFLEHESVKGSARNNQWVAKASGKAVKVVSQLCRFLPPTHRYRVVVMQRPVSEVVVSQLKMMEKLRGKTVDRYPLHMETTLQKQYDRTLAWMREQPNFNVLEVSYHDAVYDADATARRVAEFLNLAMDVSAMSGVSEASLHRNK